MKRYDYGEFIENGLELRDDGDYIRVADLPVKAIIEAISLMEGIRARNIHTQYGHDYACRLNSRIHELRELLPLPEPPTC